VKKFGDPHEAGVWLVWCMATDGGQHEGKGIGRLPPEEVCEDGNGEEVMGDGARIQVEEGNQTASGHCVKGVPLFKHLSECKTLSDEEARRATFSKCVKRQREHLREKETSDYGGSTTSRKRKEPTKDREERQQGQRRPRPRPRS